MNNIQKIILNVIGAALFNGETPEIEKAHIEPLIKESKDQTVFPLLFSSLEDQIKKALSVEKYQSYGERYFISVVAGVRNFAEHGELHEIMTKSCVPYVGIKGLASAMYYPVPSLRTMGDVDFLVAESDLEKVKALLENAGFTSEHGVNDGFHTIYRRVPMSIWEMHASINGIPDTSVGEYISDDIGNMIESAELAEVDGVTCFVPSKFHHGLIMLLHTASHLTSEGIGLRHLCDWVVFASSMSDDEFIELFEDKLKQYGLWRFAQALTLLGVKFLGAPEREWANEILDSNSFSQDYLVALMDDILNGGNFGRKDKNRYREIKFISNRGEHTVETGSIFGQVFRTLNTKVIDNYKFINKHRVFLPIGWVAEICKYIGLVINGKRKSTNTKAMLKEAAHRKNLYASLNIFKV